MRTLVISALVTALAAPVVGAQSDGLHAQSVDAATRAEIVAARDAVWRAWFAGDTARLRELIPAALAAGSRGGWNARHEEFASARGFSSSGGRLVELHFDSTSIRLRGSVAVVQARYSYVLESGGQRSSKSGIATEIFVRRNGRCVNPFWYLE